MKIYGNVKIRPLTIFERPLATLWQTFMVDHHFCPVPPRHLSRWFSQLPQRQCGTFVLITFSYKSVDICKLPSQTKVAIYLANQYPVCNYWKYCSVIAAVRLPQRDIPKITGVSQVARCHLKSPTPCPWEQLSYTSLAEHLLTIDDHIKRRPCPSPYCQSKYFYLSVQDQGGADNTNRAPCPCSHGP